MTSSLSTFLGSNKKHELKTKFLETKIKALYMKTEQRDLLLQHQDTLGNIQHRVQPVQMSNGDWFLCADVLTEIGEGGIFKCGFDILPLKMFDLVVVDAMPTEDMIISKEDKDKNKFEHPVRI